MKKERIDFKKVSISLLILLLFFIGGSYYFVQKGLNPVDEDSKETIEIEVPMGSNKKQIGTILEKNQLIHSSLIYHLYLRLNNEKNFQAGTYLMSPSMSLQEIIQYLNEGGTPIMPEPITRLTIPEGLTIEQIARKVEEQTDFSETDFMKLVQDEDFIQEMAVNYPELLTDALAATETRYTLEGYLYPATYEIFEDTSLESLLSDMIAMENQVMASYYSQIQENELNIHELLTLASYIEGEGVSDEDRALIAGVFYNRLEIDMLLRTDPSVSYALGEHKERITFADLEVDSPYNTYKYAGIGPGPINNPSESAIQASLNPAETDYLFFLADLKTGEVYFSKDYEQHLEYKREYLDNN